MTPLPVTRPGWQELPFGDHLLAESPRWDGATGRLVWVDILGGTVRYVEWDRGWSSPRVHRPEGLPTAVEPVPGTELWDVAAGGEVTRVDPGGWQVVARVPVSSDFPSVRTNDSFRDPRGRLLVGLFTEDRASPRGGVVSCDPELRTARKVVGEMVTANGLGLDPSSEHLYAVDTARNTLMRHPYDLATGRVGAGVVLTHHPGPGVLDGLLVRPDGSVLVAVWGEGALRRYDAAGCLVEVIGTPVSRPTALAAVDAGRAGVVLTSAREELPGGVNPVPLLPRPDGRLYWTADL